MPDREQAPQRVRNRDECAERVLHDRTTGAPTLEDVLPDEVDAQTGEGLVRRREGREEVPIARLLLGLFREQRGFDLDAEPFPVGNQSGGGAHHRTRVLSFEVGGERRQVGTGGARKGVGCSCLVECRAQETPIRGRHLMERREELRLFARFAFECGAAREGKGVELQGDRRGACSTTARSRRTRSRKPRSSSGSAKSSPGGGLLELVDQATNEREKRTTTRIRRGQERRAIDGSRRRPAERGQPESPRAGPGRLAQRGRGNESRDAGPQRCAALRWRAGAGRRQT